MEIKQLPINQILNEDNVLGLSKLPAECIDLTVTSPPYDKMRTCYKCDFNFEGLAQELYRVTKNGGVVVWIVGDITIDGSESGTSFRQALYFKNIGFKLWDTMIYEKAGTGCVNQNRYYPIFEYMFVLSKDKPKTINLIADRENLSAGKKIHGYLRGKKGNAIKKPNRGRIIEPLGVRFNIWRYSNTPENKIAYQHPAIFPLKLAEDHIKSWSNEGDLILDPFMGSGTTAIAALNLNRNYLGYEINGEYCALAEKRISARAGELF